MKLGEGQYIVRAVDLGKILRSVFPFGSDLYTERPYEVVAGAFEVVAGALASLDPGSGGAFGDAMKAMAP